LALRGRGQLAVLTKDAKVLLLWRRKEGRKEILNRRQRTHLWRHEIGRSGFLRGRPEGLAGARDKTFEGVEMERAKGGSARGTEEGGYNGEKKV